MQRSGSSPSRLYCSSLFCECPKFCDLAKQRRPATVKPQGGHPRTQGAPLLPFSSEAESLVEDLVTQVPFRRRLRTAENVGPPGCGVDLPLLLQGGVPRVTDQREEGVDRVGHSRHVTSGPG